MEAAGAEAYLVNTGWNGTGKRISIKDTVASSTPSLDGSIEKAPTKVLPVFNLEVPTELPGVNPAILDPRDTYADQAEWDARRPIWPGASSRTSSASPTTTKANAWSRRARSRKETRPRVRNPVPVSPAGRYFWPMRGAGSPPSLALTAPCALDSAKLYTIYNFATCP